MMVGLLVALQHESTQSNHQLLIISKSVKAQCATTANRCCYQDRKPSTPTSGQYTETTHIFFRTTIFLNSPSPTRAMAIFHTDEDIPSWLVPFFFDFFFNICSLDHRFLLITFIAFPVFPFFLGCTHVHVSFRTMVCYVMVFFIGCDPTEFSVSSFSVN